MFACRVLSVTKAVVVVACLKGKITHSSLPWHFHWRMTCGLWLVPLTLFACAGKKHNERVRFLHDDISEQLHLQLLSEMNESRGKAFSPSVDDIAIWASFFSKFVWWNTGKVTSSHLITEQAEDTNRTQSREQWTRPQANILRKRSLSVSD